MTVAIDYNGRKLLALPPDLGSDGVQWSRTVDMDTFTGDEGTTAQKTRLAAPNFTTSITFLLTSRQQIAEMEAFLEAVAGRAYAFYLPSWNDDLWVLSASLTQIVINYIGYTERLLPGPSYRNIWIVSRQDPFYTWGRYVGDGAAADNGDGTETLSANTDFPYPGDFNGATSTNYRFMFLWLVRLDSDEITFEHYNGELAEVTLPVFHTPEG